jgi:arginine/lysine/ornithine decarboxylase
MMLRANKAVLKNCKIYQMLAKHAKGRHLSFHTPGHKEGKWDITELFYSDNLSAPRGCIAEAERDVAQILGAYKSFLLTDGSTAGVLSMLYAAKQLGVKSVAVCEASHKSVFNGCAALGITPLVYPCEYQEKIPYVPSMYALKQKTQQSANRTQKLCFYLFQRIPALCKGHFYLIVAESHTVGTPFT